jgi:hypothetical protein
MKPELSITIFKIQIPPDFQNYNEIINLQPTTIFHPFLNIKIEIAFLWKTCHMQTSCSNLIMEIRMQ